ncbi:MAG: HAMP domain-containing histidine kinase [Afipia sp.]|nr:HAMP domain-containing histidine kinase [Afipia sp.]
MASANEPGSPTSWQSVRRALSSATASLRTGWNDVVRSVHPLAGEEWLTDAQMQLYRRSTRHSTLLLPIGAFFVALANRQWISSSTRTTWWIAIAAICVALDLTWRKLDRMPGHSLEAVRFRARCYTAMSFVFLTAWCSMGVFLWAPAEPINHMLIVLILACSLAGSIALNAVHPAMAALVFTVHVSFLLGATWFSDTDIDRTLGELSAVYALLLIGQVVALNASMTKMLRLERDRAGLVHNLQHAKIESDRERARAAAASRTKSQFLSNMNHELRTPMNAILGFSELIKSKAFGDSADKYTEYAGIIHDSGQNLLSLINDMLDLAKIEGGKMYLRENEVNFSGVIGEVVDSNAAKAESSGISLKKNLQRGLPRLFADERAIQQIVSNLVSNAIKFTPPDGTVTLFAQVEGDGRLSFGVQDTGIGISNEDQKNIFERFGGGRHDVATADKGTGLGLAIVKGFAEAHDGEVKLESRLGEGTRVTVFMPAARLRGLTTQLKTAS